MPDGTARLHLRLSLQRLLPALTLLGQLIARGTSLTDIAPKPIQPVVPSNRSNETYSLYCSRCSTSLAARPREGARSRPRAPSQPGWARHSPVLRKLPPGQTSGW